MIEDGVCGILCGLGNPRAVTGMVGDPQLTGTRGLYRFAHCEFDERAHELRIDGVAVELQAKSLGVLLSLLRRPDETLTKDELLELVWSGRVVTEGVLAKAVMKLRSVLGDDDQSIVRTIHGFGYRIGVPVEHLDDDGSPSSVPRVGDIAPLRPNWRLVESLDRDHRGLVWLAEHLKTRDRRVFKFANNADTLVTLKREITLYRLLHETLGEAAPVVKIYDWNLDQPPYFTESEWISGGDLTAWIAGDASLEERIEVMAQVCEAVAATHSVGVVHKDIKPANVLVRHLGDETVQVRLADFGIGALSDAATIEALGITRLGFTRTRSDQDSSSGTPLYLAPEVIGGRMPTQSSDIYALGVMLYQAIVADPRRSLAPGWEREIDDELLREDIASAADVDPARRLGAAAELARRLRTLHERRVQREAEREAREKADKLAQGLERARTQRRWMALVATLLLLAVVGMSTFAWHAEQARQSAQREAAKAEAINQFLHNDVLGASDPGRQGDYARPIGAVIEAALARVDSAFPGEPVIAGEVYRTLGAAMLRYGSFEAGEGAVLKALKLLEPDYGPAHKTVMRMRLLLANAYAELQRTAEARQQLELVLAVAESNSELVDVAAHTQLQYAWIAFLDGDHQNCMTRYRDWLNGENRQFDESVPLALSGYARCLSALGRHEEALVAARESVALHTDRHGPEALTTLRVQFAVVSALRGLEQFQDAEQLLTRLNEQLARTVAQDHPLQSLAAQMLGSVLESQGRHREAADWYLRAADSRARSFGEADFRTATSRTSLGFALLRVGQAGIAAEQLAVVQSHVAKASSLHPELLSHLAFSAESLAIEGVCLPLQELLSATLQAARAEDAANPSMKTLAHIRDQCTMPDNLAQPGD